MFPLPVALPRILEIYEDEDCYFYYRRAPQNRGDRKHIIDAPCSTICLLPRREFTGESISIGLSHPVRIITIRSNLFRLIQALRGIREIDELLNV